MIPSYHFRSALHPENTVWDEVIQLLACVFSDTPAAELAADLAYRQAQQPVQAWLAVAGGEVIGCKLGHERKPGEYYSWLGGVLPAFRGRGIARELMRQQHAWCQAQGYRRIRTQTYNHMKPMLLLNLRQGFDIVGVVHGARGLTLVLEKQLGADPT